MPADGRSPSAISAVLSTRVALVTWAQNMKLSYRRDSAGRRSYTRFKNK